MTSFYYYDHSGKTTHQKEKQRATAINLFIPQLRAIALYNGKIGGYNLRVMQKYFQTRIVRKIRIFSLGRKTNVVIKRKECITFVVNYYICGFNSLFSGGVPFEHRPFDLPR